MRPLGITAYGCTPGHPSSIGQDKCIHAPDEWTSVDDLAARTRFFVAVLYHALVAGELD
jgi:acetylornithine deacetylase/succinyl-diaminopimelate desuccinylase-like protein